MIRTGRALFTAHTNADSASPGVSDALADALGLEVADVLSPVPSGPALDKWVVFVPAGERRRRSAPRCSRRGPGRSATTRSAAGASRAPVSSCRTTARRPRSAPWAPSSRLPRTGSRWSLRRRGGRLCSPACAALTPTRSPRSTSSPCSRPPATSAWDASRHCRAQNRCRRSSPESAARCPPPRGECAPRVTRRPRCRGSRCAVAPATRCSPRSLPPVCRPTSPPTYVTIPPTNTAASPTSRSSTSRTGPASTRGAVRRRSCCATTSVPRCPVTVSDVRTDPWNVEGS